MDRTAVLFNSRNTDRRWYMTIVAIWLLLYTLKKNKYNIYNFFILFSNTRFARIYAEFETVL